ncbi:hypothetical protein F5Y18DRAFT_402641 [Xylariaceae sp. FL1019]|nr:hypothetical protein F5Y18DRAFT_402641 [Xylariaceae sp. FL1019]
MPDTIRDALRSADLTAEISYQIPKNTGNTRIKNPPHFNKEWHPWEDFPHTVLEERCAHELDQPFTREYKKICPEPNPEDKEDGNELKLSAWLFSYEMRFVNNALDDIAALIGAKPYYHFGPIPETSLKPDWVLKWKAPGGKDVHIPGDVKVSSKWRPDMVQKASRGDKAAQEKEWMRPIQQVVNYCVHFKSRYTFVITDEVLVLFRVSYAHEATGEGLAEQRSKRPAQPHAPFSSDDPQDTPPDGDPENEGDISFGKEPFEPDASMKEYHVEYATFNWGPKAKGRRTLKTLLFCFALLAYYNSGEIGEGTYKTLRWSEDLLPSGLDPAERQEAGESSGTQAPITKTQELPNRAKGSSSGTKPKSTNKPKDVSRTATPTGTERQGPTTRSQTAKPPRK